MYNALHILKTKVISWRKFVSIRPRQSIMIESVQTRHRGAYDFESYYDNLCALQDSVPLPAVTAHLSSGILDINADRVRATDWMPILNTLQINKSLEYVAVRSFFQPPCDGNDKKSAILKHKTPAVRSKEITFRLCKALKECLCVTPTLMYIELRGLPLRDSDLQALTKGIIKNTTISHLSLEYCRIGDTGLEILCKGVKNSGNISSLNLTGCSLSARGAELIAKIIKHQGMRRHTEAWRDSLRYGQPDLDKMAGLRRITINNNPLVDNQGAQVLADALKDDLWVKALDMQATGVSTAGAKAFLDVLKYNTTLVVLDLRRNPMIERNLLHLVMEQLMINCNGQETEYQWIETQSEEPAKQLKSKRKATKILSSSAGRKTVIKVSPVSAQRWLRSPSVVRISRKALLETTKPTPGLPWRTAARANRYRGFPPEHMPCKPADDSEEESTSVLISHEEERTKKFPDVEDNIKQVEAVTAVAEVRMHQELRELRVELEQLRRSMDEEKMARIEVDRKVLHLKLENRKLRDELHLQRLKNELGMGVGDAGEERGKDESVLESIEASFKMFHAFLDMLQEAGLGELITMAGLDQKQMVFSSNNPTVPPVSSGDTKSSVITSFAQSFRTASAGATVYGAGSDKDNIILHTGRKIPKQSENFQPVSSPVTSPQVATDLSMSHINEDAYMAEKHAADKLYERLVQQTSGAFTSAYVSSTSGVRVHRSPGVVGSISTAPTEIPGETLTEFKTSLSPTPQDEHYSSSEHHPTLIQNPARPEKNDEEAVERPVPTPRQKTSHLGGWDKKDSLEVKEEALGNTTDRGVPSRASEASYSMDSFERSYMTENGEVVVLKEDDLFQSQPLDDSGEEDF